MAESKSRVLEAEELRLVDDEGRLWAMLHAKRGCPTLELRDEERRAYITIEIQDGRPILNISRNGVQGIIALAMLPEGDIRLSVAGSDGKFRFMMSVSQDGDAELTLADRSGDSVAWHAP